MDHQRNINGIEQILFNATFKIQNRLDHVNYSMNKLYIIIIHWCQYSGFGNISIVKNSLPINENICYNIILILANINL